MSIDDRASELAEEFLGNPELLEEALRKVREASPDIYQLHVAAPYEDGIDSQSFERIIRSNGPLARDVILAIARNSPDFYLATIPQVIDERTGTFNASYLVSELIPDVKKAVEDGNIPGFSFVMWDIDNFKRVNDTYGHIAGNQVLAYFARHLQEGVRTDRMLNEASDLPKHDLVVRWGGEEFCTVLPGVRDFQAHSIVDRLRSALESRTYAVTGKDGQDAQIGITVSGGITYYRRWEEFEDFLRRADNAMYRAKESGRNQAHIIA